MHTNKRSLHVHIFIYHGMERLDYYVLAMIKQLIPLVVAVSVVCADEYNHRYKEGDRVDLWVNKVSQCCGVLPVCDVACLRGRRRIWEGGGVVREKEGKAREEEVDGYKIHGVYVKVQIKECWDQTGKDPIGTRWIDINKGDEMNP